jgi:phosphatidylglycerophosphate synthase
MKFSETKNYLEFKEDKSDNFYKYLAWIPTWILSFTPITGNQVTLISMFFLILGGTSYYLGLPFLGFGLMLIYNILDYVDGSIARYRNKKSLRGYFLDGMCHQLVIPIICMSIGLNYFLKGEEILFLYLAISGSIFNLLCEITRYRRRVCLLEKTSLKGKEVGIKVPEGFIKKSISFLLNTPIGYSIYIPIILLLFNHIEYTLWVYGITTPIRWIIIFYRDSIFNESQMIQNETK